MDRVEIGRNITLATLLLSLPFLAPVAVADDVVEGDTILKALKDELARSMTLQLGNLEKPYWIQYWVDDRLTTRMSASYGALINSGDNRSRSFHSQVRVGSYDLDSSNFAGGGGGGFRGRRGGGRRPRGGGGGGGTQLPIDDNYIALRQAIWAATDRAYKGAVDTLTQKRTYMEDRNIKDRPADFTKMEPTTSLQSRVTLSIDRGEWEENLRRISAHFDRFPQIHNSSVNLVASAENRYMVNSEGSLLRDGDTSVLLRISADSQADDGEVLSDGLAYFVDSPEQLPAVPDIISDIDTMVKGLDRAVKAPVLEDYAGPVLFDGLASAQMFEQILAGGMAGRPVAVGTERRRRGRGDLEGRLGKRILPSSFQVFDDPRPGQFADMFLAGHYLIDDEGVPTRRVDLVVDGKLKTMTMSRTPTKKLTGSNGHGRRSRGGDPRAALGCLYVESTSTLPPAELKKALIEAAEDQGLEYGLRVTSLRGNSGGGGDIAALIARFRRGGGRGGAGGGGGLSDPIYVYKVYVEDGREEPVRGCEFGELNVRTLTSISAAGDRQTVYNRPGGGGAPLSIIAPSILFEALALASIDQEAQRKPILEAPHARDKTDK